MVVPPFIGMVPRRVIMLHRFIVNVQPSFPTTTVSIWMEHVDRIMPTAYGFAVVVKHPIELVVRSRLRRFPRNGCHDFWTDRATRDS